MVAAAVVGAAVVGGVMASSAQEDAADTAAAAQTDASNRSIAEQRRQFNAMQALLKPYADAGVPSLTMQQDILGLNGDDAQQKVIAMLENSPKFAALTKQGENAIIQNASATGGLRGGNTQSALAQFRPQLLSQMINEQYANLAGITSLGQNAAAMTGNAGMQMANAVSEQYGNIGSAQAGAALASGQAQANMWNTIGSAPAMYYGMKGGGGFGGSQAPAWSMSNGGYGGIR